MTVCVVEGEQATYLLLASLTLILGLARSSRSLWLCSESLLSLSSDMDCFGTRLLMVATGRRVEESVARGENKLWGENGEWPDSQKRKTGRGGRDDGRKGEGERKRGRPRKGRAGREVTVYKGRSASCASWEEISRGSSSGGA